MESAITEAFAGFITHISIWAYLFAFLGGVITSIGPCNITMIPIIVAYVGGFHESRSKAFFLSSAFAIGSAVTFMLLGVFMSFIGGIFGFAHMILYLIVAIVCIAIGLSLLGVFHLNFPVIQNMALLKRLKGITGSFLLGMLMGVAGSQCATPILIVILSLVMAKGQIGFGASLLFVYALGRGVPIILAGTFTGVLTSINRLNPIISLVEKAAGAILIVVGIYFAWTA